MRVLGIDEAGRGCVLGDLVIGAFCVEDPDDSVLREAGADDSKRLTAAKRRAARERLGPLGLARVVCIDADAIDGGNLNQLEEAAIVTLIRELQPDRVYIDALGHPNAMPAVMARFQAQLTHPCELIIEPKADRTYPVVGAASIFAKTTRDARLEAHAARHGHLGSGYPSDPATKAWLRAHAATGAPWPGFVRTRWQTIRDLAQAPLFG